ncbi:MFS transporter [Halalkalibacillus halophilus]|uniref:MFS transporter n=1 Tax=Halalkalibacillus halophilus TaxID=392827 RepID=UPI00040457E8|nr:MFS transporter [Halalkalibacillus halophilus]
MSLYKERNFQVLWFGQLATIFGNRFSEIAIPLIVLQLTGSPWHAALVVVCSQLAPLFLSLPASSWIENQRKRSVALLSEAISFMTMVALVLFVVTDQLTIWMLAGSLLILGASGLFFRISFGAMVPGVVGRNNLVKAHNSFEGADAVSTLFGPTLAGIVLSAYGVAAVLSIDATTYLISFLGILFLSYKEKKKVDPIKKTYMQSYVGSLANIKLLFKNEYQRFTSSHMGILNFTTTAVTLTVIIYTNQTLGMSEWQTGLVLSAAGAGNLVGVFILQKVQDKPWRLLYAFLMAVSGFGLVLLLSTDLLLLLMLGMFLFDGALSMAFVVNGSARQAITPNHYLARIGGGGMLLAGTVAIIGNLFAGSVSEWVGPQIAIGICAALLFLGCLITVRFKNGNKSVNELEPIELD